MKYKKSFFISQGIRLVRCAQTGVGKGIGYVSFAFMASVETALTMNGTVYINNRPVRVSKCVKKLKKKEEVKKKAKPRSKKETWREDRFMKKYFRTYNLMYVPCPS